MSSDLRKRLHKIKESIYTLNTAINEIVGGYRFNDSMGQMKIKHLEIARDCAVSELEKIAKQLEEQDYEEYMKSMK